MSNTKITELTALTQCAATDVLPIVKVSANTTKKVSISDLLRNAPAGTAGAPGIANADDQDTGILFPAANSVGVSTGGTQRLVIDSSGNVGIGTTSPNHELCISSASPLIQLEDNDHNYTTQISQSGSAFFIDSDSANAGSSSIRFRVGGASEKMRISSGGNVGIGTTNPTARLYLQNDQGGSNGRILFDANVSSGYDTRVDATDVGLEFTAKSNSRGFAFKTGSTPSEKVRISSSGNVGIGTSSPATILHVAQAGIPKIRIEDTDTNGGVVNISANGAAGFIDVEDDDGTSGVLVYRSPATTERLRIDTSGNVGIGTSSPDSELSINTGNTNTRIDLADERAYIGYDTSYGSSGALYLDGGGSANKDIALQPVSTGNVGIGTSSPSANLHVSRGDGNPTELKLTNSEGTYKISANANVVTHDSNQHLFRNAAGSTEYARINSSGNIGIGTSSPAALLHLAANAPYITFEDIDNNQDWQLQATAWFALRNQTTSSELLRVDSSGNVGIGTSSPGGQLDVSGTSDTRVITRESGNSVRTDLMSQTSQGGVGTTSNHPFFIQTNGSERLRIDTSGRLLIGTTSSRNVGANTEGRFQLEQTASKVAFSIVNNVNSATGGIISLAKTRGTAAGSTTVVQNSDQLGEIRFVGADGTDVETNAARISCFVDGNPGANDMPGRLTFSTTNDGSSTPTDRMLIAKNGQFQYFTNSSINYRCSSTSASFSAIILKNNASSISTGTTVFVVAADGDVLNTNNSYTGLSDIKLKENIVDASSQWEDLKALRVRNYNYKEGLGYGTHTQIGLVAQEVESVSPGLVKEKPDLDDEDNDLGTVTKSVSYSVLYMKAVKALQEAMDRIETLEAKVAALEAQ